MKQTAEDSNLDQRFRSKLSEIKLGFDGHFSMVDKKN